MDLSRILTEGLPLSMVNGRVALVGREFPGSSLISTPIHRGDEALSALEYEALCLEARLRDGIVRPVSRSVSLSVTIAMAILLVWLTWHKRPHQALWIAGLFIGLTLIHTAISLWAWDRWFPPLTGVLCFGSLGIIGGLNFSRSRNSSLKAMLLGLSTETQERLKTPSFYSSRDPWPLIEELLLTTFGHPFQVLLRQESGHWCPATPRSERLFEDQFGKAPQQDAAILSNQGFVPLANKNGELSGGWLSPSWESSSDATHRAAEELSKRIVEAFDQRAEWQRTLRPSDRALGTEALHDRLSDAIDLIDADRRLILSALDHSSEAVLVYDGFARLLHASSRSMDILGQMGIELGKLSLHQLVTEIGGLAEEDAHQALRYLMLENGETRFLAKEGLVEGRQFLLSLSTSDKPSEGSVVLPGVIVFLRDVTDANRARLVKDEFIESIFERWDNDFEAILAASGLLNDERLASDERQELGQLLAAKVEESGQLIDGLRQHLESRPKSLTVERYPINIQPVFDAATARVRPELEAAQLTLEANISDYLSLVIGSPEPLEDIFHTILLTLIHDAHEESPISVSARQDESLLYLEFENRGYGMPQERLEAYLDDESQSGDPLELLGRSRETIRAWAGDLTIHSQVGQGMQVTLAFKNVY